MKQRTSGKEKISLFQISIQSLTKYLVQSKEIQLTCTRFQRFVTSFCLFFFHSYCQSLIFWKEYWALGCVSIRIWHFLTFPKILSLKSFGNSWGNSCTKFVIILDISIVLIVAIRTCAELLKVPNIMTGIVVSKKIISDGGMSTEQ